MQDAYLGHLQDPNRRKQKAANFNKDSNRTPLQKTAFYQPTENRKATPAG